MMTIVNVRMNAKKGDLFKIIIHALLLGTPSFFIKIFSSPLMNLESVISHLIKNRNLRIMAAF